MPPLDGRGRRLHLPLTTGPKPSNSLRVVCVSDTHGLHTNLKVPPGDILIHAGDFTMTGELEAVQHFRAWLNSLPHRYKVVIAGNHDVTFEQEFYARNWARFHTRPYNPAEVRECLRGCCIYLQDSGVSIEGIDIYGSPWCVSCFGSRLRRTESYFVFHGMLSVLLCVVLFQATRV